MNESRSSIHITFNLKLEDTPSTSLKNIQISKKRLDKY